METETVRNPMMEDMMEEYSKDRPIAKEQEDQDPTTDLGLALEDVSKLSNQIKWNFS